MFFRTYSHRLIQVTQDQEFMRAASGGYSSAGQGGAVRSRWHSSDRLGRSSALYGGLRGHFHSSYSVYCEVIRCGNYVFLPSCRDFLSRLRTSAVLFAFAKEEPDSSSATDAVFTQGMVYHLDNNSDVKYVNRTA
jgi:hypothetical protein